MAQRGKLKKSGTKEVDERPVRLRKYLELLLIVCEDQKTEPEYFKAFKALFPPETVYLREVGTGKDPLGVVQQAIVERDLLADESKKKIDHVWAVFDKDDAHISAGTILRFSKAFEIAGIEDINVAYSNEVFELWLLLHLKDVKSNVPLPRAQIYLNLESAIKSDKRFSSFKYDHKKPDPKGLFEALSKLGSEKNAIKRAEKLALYHNGNKPIDSNPHTTIHLLVKKIRELVEWHNI